MHKPLLRIKKPFAILLLILCIATGSFISCRKASPSWDVNILAPVINASLSIDNLLPDTLVQRNPDSSVTLVYNSSLYSVNTDSLVKLPDTTLLDAFVNIFGTQTIGAGQPVIPTNNSYTTYNISNVELKKAIVQSGFVDFEVTSYVNQVTDYTYTVPSATLGGNPFTVNVSVPAYNGITPGRTKKTYSLANYQLDLTGATHNSYNTIQTILSGIVDPAAATATFNNGDSIVIKAIFYNIIPYYALGYFGTTTKTYNAQVTFPLFKKIIGGSLALQNIDVNMVLENQIGVDARVNIAQLSSVNTRTNTTVNLTDPALINNNININRATPTNNPSSPVNPSVQSFTLNPLNSNILPWVDNLPNYVNYSLQVTTDPLGNVSGSNDFAYQGYGILSNLNISIPLSLIATNLTLEDTLKVSFPVNSKAQQVKSGTFTLYVTNGFPFSAGIQIFVLDSTMHITDSLVTMPNTIAAGIMNSNGVVVTPENSTIAIRANATQAQHLLKASHIIILSRFNMGSDLPPVYRKIYSYYLLDVKLVGNFDYQFN